MLYFKTISICLEETDSGSHESQTVILTSETKFPKDVNNFIKKCIYTYQNYGNEDGNSFERKAAKAREECGGNIIGVLDFICSETGWKWEDIDYGEIFEMYV